MKIAHVILVHKNPLQVLRLTRRLSHPDAEVWVHVDRKRRLEQFKDALHLAHVHQVRPRVNVKWGSYDIVQAMLNGMKAVVASRIRADYVNFLSGQDYPLQSPANFQDFLSHHRGDEFIGNRPLEESPQNISRIQKYHFNHYSWPANRLLARSFNALLPQRVFPYPFVLRKGPQWMALTIEAVRYILDFVGRNPRYVRYFRYVHAPDELFFQTILYNSPFRDNMKNHIFHYIDWSEQKSHPRTLSMLDKEPLLASPLFFARKFDASADSSILDVLDERIASLPAAPDKKKLHNGSPHDMG